MNATPAIAFLIIGIVFLVMSRSGQRGLLGVGVAFVAIGVALLARRRRP